MWGLARRGAVSCLAQGRDVGLPLSFVHKGNSMKYAVIAAMMLATPVVAAEVDESQSKTVVQTGEVIGSRVYLQPTLGFELLIRYEGGLYICRVDKDIRYRFNGQPSVDFVAVKGCISQDAD